MCYILDFFFAYTIRIAAFFIVNETVSISEGTTLMICAEMFSMEDVLGKEVIVSMSTEEGSGMYTYVCIIIILDYISYVHTYLL